MSQLPDLKTTTQYWWNVDQMAALWHITPKTVRGLLGPHRGKCHLGRRGKNPRLVLWVPLEVVRTMDRERRAQQAPAA